MQSMNDLKIVTINLSNKCQMSCENCPHEDPHYNENEDPQFMSINTISTILYQLKHINYKGKLSISGFGEPFLHPDICDIIKFISKSGIDFNVITNGIQLSNGFKYKISRLIDIIDYIPKLEISIHEICGYPSRYHRYDVLEMCSKYLANNKKIIIRNHDTDDPNNTLVANNRNGMVSDLRIPSNQQCILSKMDKKPNYCYYPFYEIMIDADGSYLLCANDFGRKTKNKGINIFNLTIDQYFLGYLYHTKLKMSDDEYNRKLHKHCEKCDCIGILEGKEEFDNFKSKR